jgi:membrane associated rhomboid family serine protease
MLLIPLARKFDWHHPPVMTFLIVLVNVLVYAIWQSPSQEHRAQALEHYFDSGLAKLEFPRYARYLAQRQDREWAPVVRRAMAGSEQDMVEAVYTMQADEEFQRLLHAGQIVVPDDPAYPAWREAREQFDRLFAKDWDWQHSFIPVNARWDTWLTHMFMHAGWGHLAGNMVVLLVVGFVVEQVLGWWLFLLFYLLSGFGAVAMFWAFNPSSAIPLLGASGAVSGVSGMYAAIFGLRKINFFYFAWVYFDYVKAPAILLLVVWLANEIFQQLVDPESQVAYVAHVGGLLTGAALIGLAKVVRVGRIRNFLAEATAFETDQQQFQRAMALAESWQLDEAGAILDALTERRPDDYELLMEAYQVAKLVPDSSHYHSIAGRILALPTGNRAALEAVAETFREYMQIARPRPRLGVTRGAALAQTFSAAGLLNESERLAEMLAKQDAPRPEVAAALLAVGEALLRAGQPERADRWLRVVVARFPGSPQGDRASTLMPRT